MKKLFDDEDDELNHEEKAKILVTIIPFVLIIFILMITLAVNGARSRKEDNTQDLQQSIMDYADDNIKKDEDVKPSAEPVAVPTGERTPEPTPVAEEEKPTAVPTKEPYKPVMGTEVDYSKVEFDKDEQLAELMYYWDQNNQKALDDLANLERFLAMSWQLRGTKEFYYYGDRNGAGQPHGKGIAVYADNQYYYGEWQNGVRSGQGKWMHYHIDLKENKKDLYTYHQYVGGWYNDLPEGEGSEHYEYDMSLLKENVGYNTNLIGTYSKGLVHGDFYLTNIYSDGSMKEWNAKADAGSWIYLSKNRDKVGRGPVLVDTKDPENYIWMTPKENCDIGVDCLLSVNKN